MEPTITLISSDGEEIKVEQKTIERSILIRNAISDVGEEAPIALKLVHSSTLKLIIEWLDRHKKDPIVEDEQYVEATNIDKWDEDFLSIESQKVLYDLVLAANYMNIKHLLDIGCQAVAKLFKDKTLQDIRDTFGMEHDFTPEEEAQVEDIYQCATEGKCNFSLE